MTLCPPVPHPLVSPVSPTCPSMGCIIIMKILDEEGQTHQERMHQFAQPKVQQRVNQIAGRAFGD